MVNSRNKKIKPLIKFPLRIGLFGIGLEAYRGQFDGLKTRLEGYVQTVAQKLDSPGIEIVNLGLIDSPEKALVAGHEFRRADVDLIFLHVTTYALSSTVLPVVQRARVPVIILNLQPVDAIDYTHFNALNDRTRMTGEWLAHCAACPVPEIANAFNRAGIDFPNSAMPLPSGARRLLPVMDSSHLSFSFSISGEKHYKNTIAFHCPLTTPGPATLGPSPECRRCRISGFY